MDRMLDATAAAEDTHFWFAGLRRNGRFLLERALIGAVLRAEAGFAVLER